MSGARRPSSRNLAGAILAAGILVVLAYFRDHPPFLGERPVPSAASPATSGAGTDGRDTLLAIVATILLAAAAWAWGRLLWPRFAARTVAGRATAEAERILLEEGIGLAVLGAIVFVAGEASVFHPWIAWAATVLPLAVVGWHFRRGARGRFGRRDIRLPSRLWSLESAAALAAVLTLGATLAFALAPLTANDALVYHLNLPRLYIERGSTAPVSWNVYSRMPEAIEYLYTFARALGPEATPRVLHAWFAVLAFAATYLLARRHSRQAALISILVLAGTPLLFDPRTVGNVDLGISVFFALALLAGLGMGPAERPRGLAMAGVFLGFMAGARYTALALAGLAMAVHVWRTPGTRRRDAGTLALAITVGAIPWMIRAWVRSGNPLYPLLPGILDGVEWSQALGTRLVAWQHAMGMGRGVTEILRLPWNLSVHGQVASGYRFFDGDIGPWYLVLAALWIAGWARAAARERTIAVMLGAGFLLWAAGPQQARFAMPLLLPGAALGASALAGRSRSPGASMTVIILALAALFHGAVFSIRASRETGAVLTGSESRDAYLGRRVQSYAAMSETNRVLPPGARLLLVWENRGYYLRHPYVADSFFEASQLMDLARRTGSAAGFAAAADSMGITHVMVNDALGRYFSTRYGDLENRVLADFVAGHLAPLGSANGVTLYEFRPAGRDR